MSERGQRREPPTGAAAEPSGCALLAVEHRLVRDALGHAVGLAGFEHVEQAADGAAAADLAARVAPAVAFIEVSLPPCGGIRTGADIKAASRATKVLLMSPQPELQHLVDALEAGADGFIDMSHGVGELTRASLAVLRGESFVPGEMLAQLLRELIESRRRDTVAFDLAGRLRPREREVLALLVQGHNHQGVAKELVMSPATARTHIQNLFKKLGVHSRLEAISLAIEYKLVAGD